MAFVVNFFTIKEHKVPKLTKGAGGPKYHNKSENDAGQTQKLISN